MRIIRVSEECAEHCKSIGLSEKEIPGEVRIPDGEYAEIAERWRKSLPEATDDDINCKVAAHYIYRWERKYKRSGESIPTSGFVPTGRVRARRLDWVMVIIQSLILALLLAMFARPAKAQFSHIDTIGFLQGGSAITNGFFAFPFQVNCAGNLTCTSDGFTVTATGGAGGSTAWSDIGNPTANLGLTMGAYTTVLTYNAATGASVMFRLTDTLNNTGTGYLFSVNSASGSGVKPVRFTALGTSNGVEMTTAGVLTPLGSGVINATKYNGNAIVAVADGGAGAANTGAAGKVLIGNGSGAFVEGDPLVQGLTAHDAAGATTSPVAIGGYASAAAPSDVSADVDITRMWVLRNGSPVVNLASGGTLLTGGSAGLKVDLSATGANSNKILVTPDSVALPANQSVNISQINGVTPLMGNGATGTGALRVSIANDSTGVFVGTLADNGAASGTNRLGTLPAVVDTNLPSAETSGRNAALHVDKSGTLRASIMPTDLTTYVASKQGLATASSATDIAVLPGNATNTVIVSRVSMSCIQTTAGIIDVQLIKRSTADSGGTSGAMTVVPLDSGNAAGVSAPLTYTANPTLGTTVGSIDTQKIGVMAAATATPNDVYIWTPAPGQSVVLRGTAQQLAINLNGVTVSGSSCDINFQWVETTGL